MIDELMSWWVDDSDIYNECRGVNIYFNLKFNP